MRVESLNFCIDLNLLTYGKILAYICCISTLMSCETTPEMQWGLSWRSSMHIHHRGDTKINFENFKKSTFWGILTTILVRIFCSESPLKTHYADLRVPLTHVGVANWSVGGVCSSLGPRGPADALVKLRSISKNYRSSWKASLHLRGGLTARYGTYTANISQNLIISEQIEVDTKIEALHAHNIFWRARTCLKPPKFTFWDS